MTSPAGWLRGSQGHSYPPEPWRLHGVAAVSFWIAPSAADRTQLPPGVIPLALAGRALYATAWVNYLPGGVLTYRELLGGFIVWAQWRPAICITHIWVDNESSRAGGRELWGIPKELAEFRILSGPPFSAEARVGTTEIASFSFAPGWQVPGHWATRTFTAQTRQGRRKVTALRAGGRVTLGAGHWQINPQGPLGFLAARKPLFTFQLDHARLEFGLGGKP